MMLLLRKVGKYFFLIFIFFYLDLLEQNPNKQLQKLSKKKYHLRTTNNKYINFLLKYHTFGFCQC